MQRKRDTTISEKRVEVPLHEDIYPPWLPGLRRELGALRRT